MIVIDASAALEWLLRTRGGETVERMILGAASSLHAPHLIDVEVAHVLRRRAMRGEMDAGRAREALDDFAELPLRRHEHTDLLARAWSMRANLSAYDAIYVALAEAIDATLLTCDKRLAAAAAGRLEIWTP
ncbi:MAG: type II toxin-antitoxin system VapC family toxin [Hyphomicrobiales bacterium]|nr:type II toxin-antitoxin system VapC family toxin [Hyphomicrobiales bacterium]MDE2018448.1 type II toxin-antitoxin system VapC family toxin [Hyphomicrobiales bacterium]